MATQLSCSGSTVLCSRVAPAHRTSCLRNYALGWRSSARRSSRLQMAVMPGHLRTGSSRRGSQSQGSPLRTTICQSQPAGEASSVSSDEVSTDTAVLAHQHVDTSFSRSAPDLWNPDVVLSMQKQLLEAAVDTKDKNTWIKTIRQTLKAMLHSGGEINVSAYDTAWVARVPSLSGVHEPEFPQALQWVKENQFEDGSWGDRDCFLLYDRIIHTLGCILALRTWDTGSDSVQKGIDFIRKHLDSVLEEEKAHMPIGFELVFPSMVGEAKKIGLDLPYDSPLIKVVCDEMQKKLQRIPVELLLRRPTTMLHSLEGFQSMVDWRKVLRFQQKDGSILSSPTSTAVVLVHTGDRICHDYLSSLLKKFGNAVPTVYPIDTLYHLWVVDTLERLGIDHHFEQEVSETLEFIYRHWSDAKGIGWTKNGDLQDMDITSMAFRLFRLHGFQVSSEALRQFENDGKFSCYAWQTSEGVSTMLNLYRASQVAFPNEVLIKQGGAFALKFLQNKLAENKGHADKWCLKKNLTGEVAYAIGNPRHKSLPLLEVRSYIDNYGPDDAWIAKTLYRLPVVNNRMYLDLAKVEYNQHQLLFQDETQQILGWYRDTGVASLSFDRHRPVEMFFAIAANMFEAEFSAVRLYWTKCALLVTVVDDLFDNHACISDLYVFVDAVKRWDPKLVRHLPEELRVCYTALFDEVNNVCRMASELQGENMSTYIRQMWERHMKSIMIEAEWTMQRKIPTFDECKEVGTNSSAVEPIVMTAAFACGIPINSFILSQLDSRGEPMRLISYSCRLLNDVATYKYEKQSGKPTTISCYLDEHQGVEEKEAIASLTAEIEKMREQINLELARQPVPAPCKRVLVSMYRAFNYFYSSGRDTVSANTEIQHDVRKALFEPGASVLAKSLKVVNEHLTSLDLGFNEIRDTGAFALAQALKANGEADVSTLNLTSKSLSPKRRTM